MATFASNFYAIICMIVLQDRHRLSIVRGIGRLTSPTVYVHWFIGFI